MRRLLFGTPIVSGPRDVRVAREDKPDGTNLTASHDGYADAFDVIHHRALRLSPDGRALDGEDSFTPAAGAALPAGKRDEFAVRFHLHPSIKANRLSDGRGVILLLPDRELWTFNSLWRSGADRGKRVSLRLGRPAPHRADRDLRPRPQRGQGALELPPHPAGAAGHPPRAGGRAGIAAVIILWMPGRTAARSRIHFRPLHVLARQPMTSHPRRITRALLSVSDKTGLVDFATALAGYGVELISTGGTAKALKEAGLKVIDVAELTGFPEMMDGRVKTLHPKVHGGLLAIRANKEHAAAMDKHGIKPIDLLVVNLYPFEATVAKGAAFDDCIENIDIGGPAMIRAAAKNHADVTVVVEPADYEKVLAELALHSGMTSLELRQKLAAKAYARTAAYDAAISNWFADTLHDSAPDYRAFGGKLIQSLRYGENPHQSAAFYRAPGERFGVATARQVQGKELSYNNINDTDAAYECVAEFDAGRTAACVIVKHANPCGVAEGAQPASTPTARRWPAIPPPPSAASSRSTASSTPRRPRRSPRFSPR